MNNNKNEFTYSGYQFSLLVIVMTCIIPVNSIGELTGRSESFIVYNMALLYTWLDALATL